MQYFTINNVNFPFNPACEQTKTQLRVQISQARKKRRKLKNALKKAGKSISKKDAQHDYVSSASVRFAYLIDASKRHDLKERQTIQEYWEMAKALKLNKPIDEKVHIRLKSKGNGKYRYYCAYGPRHLASQLIVSEMLKVQFKPRGFQFNTGNGGVQGAVKQIRKYYKKEYIHRLHLDIVKFYDSFSHEAMLSNALPIEKEIAKHVVIGAEHKLDEVSKQGSDSKIALLMEAHHLIGTVGIPQGSACSPIIGNLFLSKLDVKMPHGCILVNFADDFLVLGKSHESVVNAKNALISAIADVPVGNFELLGKSSGSSDSGFNFLGHSFSINADGELFVGITMANKQKFNFETAKRYAQLENIFAKCLRLPFEAKFIEEGVISFIRYMRGWLQAFSEADDQDEYIEEVDGLIETACMNYDLDVETLCTKAKKLGVLKYELYPK